MVKPAWSVDAADTAANEPSPMEDEEEEAESQADPDEPMVMEDTAAASSLQPTAEQPLRDIMFGVVIPREQIANAARLGTPGFPMVFLNPITTLNPKS